MGVFMSEACSFPISCTYNCEPRFQDDPECPYVTGIVGQRKHVYPFKSRLDIDLWGKSLTLFATDRVLEYGYTIDSKNGVECDAAKLSGQSYISEDCTYTESVLHYVNQTDQVALYTTKLIKVSFANSSSAFASLAVGGFPVHFLKLPMGGFTYSIETSVILRKCSEELIQDTYKHTSTTDTKVFFLLPTPDPRFAGGIPMDAEIRTYGFYNQYESCADAANNPDSKVMLDGGRDMFFPQWLRSIVKDPFVMQHRDFRSLICATGVFVPQNVTSVWNPPKVSPIPCGSYVKHSEWGEMYNFFVKAVSHDGMLNIKSDNFDELIMSEVNTYLPEGEKEVLGPETIYYPISLL